MVSPAFAASFTDLQNAINGTEGTGTEIEEGSGRYGYSWNEATEEKEGYWGIEAWDTKTTDDEGNETTTRNVQLNEDVKREKVDSTNGTNRIEVSGGQDIALDLNGNTIYGAGYGKQNSAITVTGEDTSLTLKDEQGGGAIFGGNSSQLADGVVVDDGASFTMESGTITGFAGRHGVNVKDGTFVMQDGEITKNTGGVLVNGADSSFTMDGGKIFENKNGASGGGVAVSNDAVFTMNSGEITGNKTNASGGGVSVDHATFEMTAGNITGNTAGSGGGIFCGNNSTLQLTTSESEKEINISDNVSGGHGGGIFSSGKSSLTLDGVNLERNQAGPNGFGGAVFAQTSIDINNTTMRDNTAGTGSAVRVHGQGSKVSISNSVIENTAASEAFIISAGPNAEIFLSKTTLFNGNAIAAEGGSLTMEDTTIKNGSVSLDRYPGRVASFESNGFKVQIDGEGNVSITDADGNAVEAVLDAKGNRLSAGKLESISGAMDIILVLPLSLPHTHTPGTPVRENEIPAQVHVDGACDMVIYCTDCGEELSRTSETMPALDHVPGEAVRENEVPAQVGVEGSYDLIIRCTVCGEVISSEHVTVPALPPEEPGTPDTPAIPDDDGADDDDGYTPATTVIEDQEVPLAGLLPVAQLLEELRQYAEVPEAELPEDFKWLDHEFAQAIYWGLQEELVSDTVEAPFNPEEVVTVALLREVLVNFAERCMGLDDFAVTLEGEDGEMVMDTGARLTAFYGRLEAALLDEAA
jgi:hypothetical protein